MPRGARVFLLAAGAAAMLALAGLALAQALTEEPVRDSDRNETQAAAARTEGGVEFLAWSQSRKGHGDRFDAFLKKGTGTPLKLNREGQGFSGGIDPPWVVYQQIVKGKSDLRLYRTDTRKRPTVPAGVNTKHWEWGPTISGDWLLFGRAAANSTVEQLILFNRKTKKSRLLASVSGASDIGPGQVNGKWAVWHTCTPNCDVFLHYIPTKVTQKLQKPVPTEPQWSAGVTKDGVVYVGRGAGACGANVRIFRYRRSGDPVIGAQLTTPLLGGFTVDSGFARKNKDGSVDFYYSRIQCSTGKQDIYRVVDPPPP